VEVEDDRPIGGEKSFELAVCQAVRMLRIRHQLRQIHHIDKADLDIGQVLPEQGRGGQRLHCRAVPTARHDHVRLAALVVARPVPDAYSLVQCSIAASMSRYWRCTCLSATMTLM
jgi:hypothetical protein